MWNIQRVEWEINNACPAAKQKARGWANNYKLLQDPIPAKGKHWPWRNPLALEVTDH